MELFVNMAKDNKAIEVFTHVGNYLSILFNGERFVLRSEKNGIKIQTKDERLVGIFANQVVAYNHFCTKIAN